MPKSAYERTLIWGPRIVLLLDFAILMGFSYLLLAVLSINLSAIELTRRVVLYFEMALWILMIFICITQIFLFVRRLDPLKNVLRDSEALPSEHPLQKALMTLEKESKYRFLQIRVSKKIKDVTSIDDPSTQNAWVLFPKQVIEVLDQDQLGTIFLHEFYHVLTGLEEQLVNYKISRVLAGKIRWFQLLLPVAIFTEIFNPVPLVDSAKYTPHYVPLIILSDILWFVALFILVALFFICLDLLRRGITAQGIISPEVMNPSELLADAYSALKSEKPEKLKTAIVLCDGIMSGISLKKMQGIDSLQRISSIAKDNKAKDNKSLKELFQMKPIGLKALGIIAYNGIVRGQITVYQSAPLRDRILLIDKLESLLKDGTSLIVRADSSMQSLKEISLLTQTKLFMNKNPDAFSAFVSYANLHTSDFNLQKCSKDLNLEIFDVFLLLLTTLEANIFDLP